MYMIFSTKIKISTNTENQSGASLMLAVLILAAVTAIAFSLATIVFIEIRSSGDSRRTEPALYATFGVTEEALFQYKRFYTPANAGDFDVPSCDGPVGSNPCDINGVTLTLPGEQPLAFDNSPRVEFVPSSGTKTIPLYVINNFENQYQSVRLETFPNSSQSAIDFYFLATYEDGTESCALGGGTPPCTYSPISPGEVYVFEDFVSGGQYELVLYNSNLSQDLSVKIETVRVDNASPSGLPFVGEQVLRIVADYLGLTRTYQVRIPIP